MGMCRMTVQGCAGQGGKDRQGKDELAGQEGKDMRDKGASTCIRGARAGEEGGPFKMATSGATEAEGGHCNRDDKMTRKERARRRGCT